MKLFDISKDVFVINLPHRTDRLEQFKEEAVKQDFKFTLVQAVNGEILTEYSHLRRGELGLLLSYRAILEEIKRQDLDRCIIFEDDACFVDNFQDRLEEEWKELPKTWHAVMLGHNARSLGAGWIPYDEISENVIQVYTAFCCHSLVLDKDIIQPFIDQINTFEAPLDVLFTRLQQNHAIFAFKKSLVEQRNSFSDIIKIDSNYKDWGIFG
jgi:GR25 family glycosyltransferase involved in LPS biosynthesis